jgi:hypothetical protein
MTTQVIFKLDRDLKKKAQKKAAAEGISFSTMLNLATRSYVEGKLSVGVIPHGFERVRMTKAEKLKLQKARRNYKNGNYYTLDQVKHELGI